MRKLDFSKKIVATLLTGTIALYTVPVLAASKDEIVYSKINGNNEDYSTIVSDKITNDEREEYINDLSSLLNIVNTSGDETFTQDGSKIVWNANGNSLSYQGETDKELPIKTTITYKLNGQEVAADELKGKEGKISITVNYENLDEHNVKINGKTEKMYTPFIVVAGLLINRDNNENITVTKGKVVDNGKNAIAIGIALPGLQESLGISKSDVDIPSSITFEMDAKDFEMNNIVSYVTPKLVEETDIKVFDDMDEIFDKANDLQSASNKLVDGANQVNEGATQLKTGMSSALSGANTIKTAVQTSRDSLANDKSSALKKSQVTAIGESASKTALAGVKSQKASIIATADKGIAANSDTIKAQMVSTAKQIAEATAISTVENSAVQVAYLAAVETAEETAWTTAQSNITTAETTAGATAKEVFEGVISSQVISGIKAQVPAMASMTDEQIKKNDVYKSKLTSTLKTYEKTENYTISEAKKEAKSTATAKLNESTIKATAKQKVDQDFDAKNGVASATSKKGKEVLATVLSNTQKAKIIAMADAGIEAQKATIEEGAVKSAKQIAETTAYTTAQSTAESVGKQVGETVASQVADTVKGAALKQVASSMGTLADGLEELTDGLDQLNSGAESLSNGTETLANGMKQFNEDGIKKIVNYINGDVKDLKERTEALKDLANDYNNFSGIDQNSKGTVSFVIIVDNIKKDDK